MNDLPPLLTDLENLLTEIEAPVIKRLNRGIDLKASGKEAILLFPPEVEQFYK